MVETEIVPSNNVGINEWTISPCPTGQAILTEGLVHKLPSRMPLIPIISAHPKILVVDRHALAYFALGPRHGVLGMGWLQLVTSWLPHSVELPRIHNLPEAECLVVAAADCLQF